jgi:hypothetical protein
MCGESHRANSPASLITPRQSTPGFPDVDGVDGQFRKREAPQQRAQRAQLAMITIPAS